jgi:hypothetical protein
LVGANGSRAHASTCRTLTGPQHIIQAKSSIVESSPFSLAFQFASYLLIAGITSSPFFLKHIPTKFPVLISAYIVALTLCGLLAFKFRSRLFTLGNPLSWSTLVVGFAVINYLLYASTRRVSALSTAPNALMEPAIAFLQAGQHPYSVRLFDGAPISPGPGWILLNAVFSLTGQIELLVPFYLAVAAFLLAKFSNGAALAFVLLLFGSLNFFQMSVTGHDLPATTLAMVALTLALYRWNRYPTLLVALALVSGLVATARVPFLVFPLALSWFLWPINRHRAAAFCAISIGTALGTHAAFFFSGNGLGLAYQPLRVFGRAMGSGSTLPLIGGVITMIAAVLALRHRKKAPQAWLLSLWILFWPFAFIGVGELVRSGIASGSTWVIWEGKNYVAFSLPFLAACIALSLTKPHPSHGQAILDRSQLRIRNSRATMTLQ